MIEQDKEYQAAGNFAWFAARDAWLNSAKNECRFNSKQKIKAESVKYALELVYSAEEVSITYCKKWIRVKVHNGRVRDRANLRLLESDWTNQGITKTNTAQGIIYHFI